MANIEDIYGLSPTQEGMLFHTLLSPANRLYFEQGVFTISGRIQEEYFERAWQRAIGHFTSLRTSFHWKELERPTQVVHHGIKLPVRHKDWTTIATEVQERLFQDLLAEDRAEGFELSTPPLLRLTIVKCDAKIYRLILSFHHLVLDAWSLQLLLRAVMYCYQELCEGREARLAPSRPYRDYIAWLQQQDLDEAESFWRMQLQGFTAPTWFTRNHQSSDLEEYRTFKTTIPAGLSTALRGLAQQNGITLNTVLQGAWAVLLSRHTGTSDIVAGVTVSGRPAELPDVENIVGLFINSLPFRVHVNEGGAVIPWLKSVQERQQAVLRYQYSPLAKVQSWSELTAGTALFDHILIFEGIPEVGVRTEQDEGLKFDFELIERTGYPLALCIQPANEIFITATFSSLQFEEKEIVRAINHYTQILESMAQDANVTIADLSLLSADERSLVLTEWNRTQAEFQPACMHRMFEQEAARTPDATALVVGNQELSWRELNSRANQVARYLRKLGAGPETLVGICAERSVEMIVGLLGILKSGSAYVPLDPSYPADRLAYMIEDSGLGILLTFKHMLAGLPSTAARTVLLDADWETITGESADNLAGKTNPDNLAYVIYTSGSTGRPKAVMISHKNVANFFAGMDRAIGCGPADTLLSMTGISFDISILELFWTLTRGTKVVLVTDPIACVSKSRRGSSRDRKMDYSLFYFASAGDEQAGDKYRLLIEGAKFADQHGLTAVWTPERHFHQFGGLYPNPAVTSAAVAAVTKRIQVRAGSVVLPLHNVIRVAEEWSVVDNLSGGRVGLAFASGWHADDFVFAPQSYGKRREITFEAIEVFLKLWQGEPVKVTSGSGTEIEVRLFPRPVQNRPPLWITAAGTPDTFIRAGEMGANVLTHLLGQTVEDVGQKVRLYREARAKCGYDPETGKVTLMLHTFLGTDQEKVKDHVRAPFTEYLRSSADLTRNLARSLNIASDVRELSPKDMNALLEYAFNRYYEGGALFGTLKSCSEMVEHLKEIGVTEIGCLIDFGIEHNAVLEALCHIGELQQAGDAQLGALSRSLGELAAEHQATVMQCTPAMVQMVADSQEGLGALGPLRTLMVGGEALPLTVARRIKEALPCKLFNMYGPTETTIWSSTDEVPEAANLISVGRPIANTQFYILDPVRLDPVPIGLVGELYIGGNGVARGYFNRPELTAERFIADAFSGEIGGRLYCTGDLARYLPDGRVELLGRRDNQVKIRGHRIELGEIETAVLQCAGVRECVVVASERDSAEKKLVAYLVTSDRNAIFDTRFLREQLQERLPAYMVPATFVLLEALPLTPNGKIDRRSLVAPSQATTSEQQFIAARTPQEEIISSIWQEVLGIERVGVEESFFELGGNSLLATRVMSRIRKVLEVELPLQSLFENPSVAGLGAKVAEAMKNVARKEPPIIRAERKSDLPLSYSQQRLWFLDHLEPGTTTYNVPFSIRLTGKLNPEVLHRTMNELVRRHEVLRTRFPERDGIAYQEILPELKLNIQYIDLRHLPPEQREQAAVDGVSEDASQVFNLQRGPLIRVKLFQLDECDHVLLPSLHHIVSDGWSLEILMREFAALYEAYSANKPSPLPELAIQYVDYAVWQRKWLQGEVLQEQIDYWMKELEGIVPLQFPTDRPRPAAPSGNGGDFYFDFSAELTEQIKSFSRVHNASSFMTLLAIYQMMLSRYSGQKDITVGTDVANRNRLEIEPVVGFLVNQLVLRARLEDRVTFVEFLEQVRRATLKAHAHQDVPFEKLVEELQPERDMSYAPIFQAKLIMQNAVRQKPAFAELTAERFEVGGGKVTVDLEFIVAETPTGFTGVLHYARDLFDEWRIAQFVEHFQRLLENALTNENELISQLSYLSSQEREEIVKWRRGEEREWEGRDVVERFVEQARRSWEAVAVEHEGRRMSYGELERRSNQLGRYLKKAGVGAEARVGVCLKPGIEMVVAVLGILKAGGAYVPLDASQPAERLGGMIRRGQVGVIVTEKGLREVLPNVWGQVVSVDEEREEIGREEEGEIRSEVEAENLAYVIFTSGSTGEPKGVGVTHGGLMNYVKWAQERYEMEKGSGAALHTSLGFDLTVTSLYPVLLSGGCVEVIGEDGVEEVVRRLEESDYSVLKLTPSHVQMMNRLMGERWESRREVGRGGVRRLVIGGEALRYGEVKRWRELGVRLSNEYGPTETVVGSTEYEVGERGEEEREEGEVPIGRAIANTEVYVLDEEGEMVGVGVIGELYIGGAGVARGYEGEAGLTAERFVPDGISGREGERLYRTGDKVRWGRDGRLEYVGRVDEQVKVRGYRIELGEIERVLEKHWGVEQAVVGVKEGGGGDKRLIGYVVKKKEKEGVGAGAGVEEEELKRYVRERLPEYMVPWRVVEIEEVPVSRNGKVERKRLPGVEEVERRSGRGEEEKEGKRLEPVEEMVAGIWEEVLGIEKVGRRENFFALGGHSLLATQVIARVRSVLGVELPLRVLFEGATVEEMASRVEQEREKSKGGVSGIEVEERRGGRGGRVELSYGQEWMWLLEEMSGGGVYGIALGVRVRGSLNVVRLEQSISEMMRRHEVLRMRFPAEGEGPVGLVEEAKRWRLEVVDVGGLEEEERQREAERMVEEERRRGFDLEQGPVVRMKLVRMGEEEHVVLCNLHHIAGDGWSFEVMKREISSLYEDYGRGEVSGLEELEVQYGDYAAWQRRWLSGEVLERGLGYWRKQLEGARGELQLPQRKKREAVPSYVGKREIVEIKREVVEGLKRMGRREGGTLYMTLLSVWAALLYQYSGQEEVVVGTVIANRGRKELEKLIGFLVNTVALRIDVSGNPGFKELLRRVREVCLEGYDHQEVPYEKVVEEVEKERGGEREPLFGVLFQLDSPQREKLELGGLEWEWFRSGEEQERREAKFELALILNEYPQGGVAGFLEYDPELFTSKTAAQLVEDYVSLLEIFLKTPEQRIGEISLAGQQEGSELTAALSQGVGR